MPRVVDAERRRGEILGAAARLLSAGGFERLTLGGLAKELGGSIRLVTHYFKDRGELLSALAQSSLRETDEVMARLDGLPVGRERLQHALEWFLADDADALQLERVRVALVPHRHADPAIDAMFIDVDAAMRRVLRRAIEGSVVTDEIELSVDVLRAWTSGVVFESVEHPDLWNVERQHRVTAAFAHAFLSASTT